MTQPSDTTWTPPAIPTHEGVDLELLDKVLTYISEHPGEWDQANWRCSTGMCAAGHAVALGGGRFVSDARGAIPDGAPVPEDWNFITGVALMHGVWAAGSTYFDVQNVTSIQDWAQLRLGLTFDQGLSLFHLDNNLDDLYRMRDALIRDPNADLRQYRGDPADYDDEDYDDEFEDSL